MPSDDIVARLREQYGRMGITSLREAADEIERLRRQVCQMSDERTEMLMAHGKIVETLTAERNVAQRYICDLSWEDSREVARQLGWDCFKETNE